MTDDLLTPVTGGAQKALVDVDVTLVRQRDDNDRVGAGVKDVGKKLRYLIH